jgi:hypothetical protein
MVLSLLPQISRPFYVAWYFLACCIGIVVGNVLLGAFYYLIFSPVGLLRRGFSRSPALRREIDRGAETYWKDVPPVQNPERYYRQF